MPEVLQILVSNKAIIAEFAANEKMDLHEISISENKEKRSIDREEST